MLPIKSNSMRGLAVFISDIRNCKSKEAEIKRVNKELANIRSKFKSEKGFDGYQKKKYICKLLFIFLLGYDLDFGYLEAVNLLSSNKYSEKQIGYLFVSVLVSDKKDHMKLVIQCIKSDLISSNQVFVKLAIDCIANIGSLEMYEEFFNQVVGLLIAVDVSDSIKQSCTLCLLTLSRHNFPLFYSRISPNQIMQLLNNKDLGIVTSSVSLIHQLALLDNQKLRPSISMVMNKLYKLVSFDSNFLADYSYYYLPSPWLTVKLLKLLQLFPFPDESNLKYRMKDLLDKLLSLSQDTIKSKKTQYINVKNGMIFETINLIIHYDNDSRLMTRACNILGNSLKHKETNLRYLALEGLCLFATSEHTYRVVKKYRELVISALKTENDKSIKQKCIDLLYAVCDKDNVNRVVKELMAIFPNIDYSLREELVLKVAILAEKFAYNDVWYVDTILQLICLSGDYVSDEVWFRTIQVITNRPQLQGYAVKTAFQALQTNPCHENMVRVGGYILGEFGNLIAGDQRSSSHVQFDLLFSKLYLCSPSTQQMLLTTFIKFANLYPELYDRIISIFNSAKYSKSFNVEMQQRSHEYLQLLKLASPNLMAYIFEEMPPFQEREFTFLSKVRKKQYQNHEKQDRPFEKKNVSNKLEKDNNNIIVSTPESLSPYTNTLLITTDSPNSISSSSSPTDISQYYTPLEFFVPPSSSFSSIPSSSNTSPLLQFSSRSLNLVSFSEQNQLYNFNRLLCKSDGVIYENDLLLITFSSELYQFRNKVTFLLFNKSDTPYSNLSILVKQRLIPDLYDLSDLASQHTNGLQVLDTFSSSTNTNLATKDPKQYIIVVECLHVYQKLPQLSINFNFSGVTHRYIVDVPTTLNKFFQPLPMTSQLFIYRWMNLSLPGQESQEEIKAKITMEKEMLVQRLTSFNLPPIPSIDPNPLNMTLGCVLHTKQEQVGILVRIEPCRQALMYRITVRSKRQEVARVTKNLLKFIL